jgi:hypothetical protein
MQLLPGRRNLARLDMSGEFLCGKSRLPVDLRDRTAFLRLGKMEQVSQPPRSRRLIRN